MDGMKASSRVAALSNAQIAELLQLKVGTVKAQLSRATGKLREMKEKQWK